jgi:haloalkane dehalogenase
MNLISDAFPFAMKRVAVLDSQMAYVEVGTGDPIVFLHGNPTSSYIWRNIIPYALGSGRCLAPDLIGFGQSGKSPRYAYTFAAHADYLDQWFDRLDLKRNVTLVVQDWGAALGFWRACRFPQTIKAIAYMEAMVRPRLYSDLPPGREPVFRKLRAPEGEQMALDENFFVEKMLFEFGTIRPLCATEKAVYRAPFPTPISRLPTLVLPREIVFDGEPVHNYPIVKRYSDWMAASDHLPKLFVNADEGHGTAGAAREFCRSWPNQQEITVHARHYLQEDAPHEIGRALAAWLAYLG